MNTDPYDIVNTYDHEHWQPIMDLLPEIEATESFGTCVPLEIREDGSMAFPYMRAEDVVFRFVKTAERVNILIPFDWVSWKEGHDILSEESFDFDSINIPTKCKLITAIIRNNRFSEGYLVQTFEKGIILKILTSIKRQLSESLEN